MLRYSGTDRDHRMTVRKHGIEFASEQARNEVRRLRGRIASEVTSP